MSNNLLLVLTLACVALGTVVAARPDLEALGAAIPDDRGRHGKLALHGRPLDLDHFSVQLFADKAVVLQRDRTTPDGGWIGHIVGQPGEATFVREVGGGGRLAGSIITATHVYQISPDNADGLTVQETAAKDIPPELCGVDGPAAESTPRRRARHSTGQLRDRRADSGELIDVLVVYSHEALAAQGSVSNMETLINLAFVETNDAYAASLINTRLRNVGMKLIDYYDAGKTFSTMLSNLRSNAEAAALRGIAYLYQSGRDDLGFSVTSRNCATGYYSFGHELGHNQGMCHDPDNAGSCNGVTSSAYGYRAPDSTFRTVLAYNCNSGCPRVKRFSNPSTTFNNQAAGSSGSNNAQALNVNDYNVANFRVSVEPCTVDSDCPGHNANFCDGTVTCESGVCQDSGAPCTTNQVCDESNDQCVACLVDTDCAGASVCLNNQCMDCREDANCDDGNPCTVDSCSVNNACENILTDPSCTFCGDGMCNGAEDCASCSIDCPALASSCGDGVCDANSESCTSCPQDCAGVTSGNPSRRFCCGSGDCSDARCNSNGYACTLLISNREICCGDATCVPILESAESCPADCGEPATTTTTLLPTTTTTTTTLPPTTTTTTLLPPTTTTTTTLPPTTTTTTPSACVLVQDGGVCRRNVDCCSGNCVAQSGSNQKLCGSASDKSQDKKTRRARAYEVAADDKESRSHMEDVAHQNSKSSREVTQSMVPFVGLAAVIALVAVVAVFVHRRSRANACVSMSPAPASICPRVQLDTVSLA